ncbi:MAG TPA: SdiA-regulated domain-containing protein, partial [Thermoguttaceae bacterium]|nr:SdiA-regulated domain-containing protein [Thermoguttaceae bacterium]
WLGNDRFAIVEERLAEISIVTIDATTTSIDKKDAQVIRPRLAVDGTSLNPDGENSGLEGIGYDARRNVLYVVKEKKARRLYEVQIDGQPGAATVLDGSTKALKAQLDDFAGMHFDSASQDFFVLSDESNCVAQVGPIGPCRSILRLDGKQVEGVTLSPDGVDLVVVGEARQFFHYRRPQAGQTSQAGDSTGVSPLLWCILATVSLVAVAVPAGLVWRKQRG